MSPGRGQTQPAAPPQLAEYAVFGQLGVTVGHESRVVSGAVGSLGRAVRLGRGVRVTNVVAAPAVRLGPDARTGRLFCHFVSGPPPLPSCTAFSDPLVDPARLPPVSVVPGTTDLRIAAHTGTAPVPAGSFRDVRVGSGSVLQLAGGAYAARSLRIGRSARVICAAGCRISVRGPVRVHSGGELGAAAAVQANGVRIDIAATGPRPAFHAARRANVSATIFAPAGDMVLAPLGAYRGAFIGRRVAVGAQTTVRGDSAL